MTVAAEGSGTGAVGGRGEVEVEVVEDAPDHHMAYGLALAAGLVLALTLGAVSRLVRRPQGLRKARGAEWKP